jgi:ABC-type polar amino acid transport system ATPase subunit
LFFSGVTSIVVARSLIHCSSVIGWLLMKQFPALAELRNRPGRTVSGGEQQLLALARCLWLRRVDRAPSRSYEVPAA